MTEIDFERIEKAMNWLESRPEEEAKLTIELVNAFVAATGDLMTQLVPVLEVMFPERIMDPRLVRLRAFVRDFNKESKG